MVPIVSDNLRSRQLSSGMPLSINTHWLNRTAASGVTKLLRSCRRFVGDEIPVHSL